jgi:molybdate transport system substrate-binding protein
MRRAAALAALALALTAPGCGGGPDDEGRPAIVVSAASSLRDAFTSYADGFAPATARMSFGGSDELAAQIRAGGRPDVYAAANAALPKALFAEGRVERPMPFASNRLVLAVPAGSRKVRALADLANAGVAVAIGSRAVPVGSYTRQVLGKLSAVERNRILANVKTAEPDVAGIVGKLTQGAVDAGFVYGTDVVACGGALRAIALPARLRPTVEYDAAVVKGTTHPAEARRFLVGLRDGDGRRALRRAGFGPPPR